MVFKVIEIVNIFRIRTHQVANENWSEFAHACYLPQTNAASPSTVRAAANRSTYVWRLTSLRHLFEFVNAVAFCHNIPTLFHNWS